MLFDEVDDFFVSSAKERDFATYSPGPFITTAQKANELDDLVPGSPFSLGGSAPAETELDMLPLLELSPPVKPGQAIYDLAQPDPLEFTVPEASPVSTPSPVSIPAATPPVIGCPVDVFPGLFVKAAAVLPPVVAAPTPAPPQPAAAQPSPIPPIVAAPGFPVIPFSGLAFMEHCVPSETPRKVVPPLTPGSNSTCSSSSKIESPIQQSPADEEETKGNSKTRKRRAPALASVPDHELNPDQLAKRMRRRQRNKESAQQSRQRKKQFMDELSEKVDGLTQDNTALRLQIRDVVAENELLKRTLHHHQIPIPRLPRPLFSQVDHQESP